MKALPKIISLKKSFSKPFFRSCTLTSVEVDLVFQPWQLVERQDMMDICET